MDTFLRFTKGFLKITWKVFKIALYIVASVAGAKSPPVCGAMEAYERREDDEISDTEFYNATRRK